MSRAIALLTVTLISAQAHAQAETETALQTETAAAAPAPSLLRTPTASPLHAGAELGLLLREEAGGQRTPSPALVLRGSWGRIGPGELSAVYQFAFSTEGTAVRGFSQHHRLHLRPEVFLALGNAALSLSGGPGFSITHTAIRAGGARYHTVYPRWTVGGELGFHVQVGKTRLRSTVDVTYSAIGRVDLLISAGAAFGFGGGR